MLTGSTSWSGSSYAPGAWHQAGSGAAGKCALTAAMSLTWAQVMLTLEKDSVPHYPDLSGAWP